ncbi:MAG: type pilus assembly protein PilM [Planctomycetota bacterium]|nr:type pilus assembly protein PilM [Planctomycetota bacterium]
MAKIQSVWAIDIGQAALKALKLMPGEDPDTLLAEAFDFIEYPKILSQPDADAEELVREALATFLGRNEVKGSKVALGVSGQAGLVKFIKLPPVEKKRIPDIVKFEARQQIPFALEEVIWDYQQIGGDEDGDDDEGFTMAEVGLFAMKRDQINRAIMPLKNAGIEVDIVQMGPIALYNFAAFDRKVGKGDESGSIVYVDIGADNSDLIITDGARIWQRNVPIGGNHFTRALTKELKLTFAKAEHLKRNATKAPDPRAVFTAMRGVFNDFSSEINRSIGFYSSVNRTAKISKVVGLGNGFKLPGLQKFLQQNLSYEVEKLESFEKLTGDEVVTAPQFVENLPSFAIAYGLAAQGLGKAPMKTNLLPPEIEQVRMVRRKKPWALAASALLMLAFTFLFLSDWSAWAKATSTDFKAAVQQADTTTKNGNQLTDAFNKAKATFDAENGKGKTLVDVGSESTNWPALFQVVSRAIPDPAKQYKRDPNDPKNFDFLSKLTVHIDAIVPRYRSDVDALWFSDPTVLTDPMKVTMHVWDRKNKPKGEGWIIQVVGHHYNPTKSPKMSAEEKAFAFGPLPYIQQHILPRFWTPELRAFGIHHAVLTWMPTPDRAWTSAKSVGANVLAPMLPAEAAKGTGTSAGSAEGSAGGGGGGGGKGGSEAFAGVGGGMPGGGMGMGLGMDGMMGAMEGAMGLGGGAAAAKKAHELKTLTRTDFKIEFIWQPNASDAKPMELAEIRKQLDEEVTKSKGAVGALDETAFTASSVEKSAKAFEKATAGASDLGKAGPVPPTSPTPPSTPAPK